MRGFGQAIIGAIGFLAVACSAAEPTWYRDYGAARRAAQAQNKLILISIHTTWCGPCREMHRTTFQNPQVVEQLRSRCICLSLDGDADAALARQLAKVYPTEILAGPDGRILDVIEGYADANRFLAALDRAAAAMTPPNKPDAAIARSQVAAPPQPPATTELAKANVEPPAPSLGGFCPVTMKERAELVRGDARFALMHEGNRFYFRSAREKALFEKDPASYLPAESGRCVVSWKDDRRWRSGRIDYPAIFGERLFLFQSSESRDRFLRDPEQFVDRSGRAYR